MALRLFEHNEKAYRAAVRMMNQYGKAAIVHPTGTGKSYIAFKLTEEQIERLNRIGMYWGNRNDRQWNQGYQEAKRYFEAHGDLRVPVNYVSPEGYALGKWVKRQRYTRLNPEKSGAVLTEERIAKLDEIGMRWDKSNPEYSPKQAAQVGIVVAKLG